MDFVVSCPCKFNASRCTQFDKTSEVKRPYSLPFKEHNLIRAQIGEYRCHLITIFEVCSFISLVKTERQEILPEVHICQLMF